MPQVERHPALQLIILLTFILGSAIIFSLLGMFFGGLLYGFNELFDVFSGSIDEVVNDTLIAQLKTLQLFSAVGIFIIPPLLLARIESKQWSSYLKLYTPPPLLVNFTFLLMIVSFPALEFLVLFNQKMHLPDALKTIEDWMRNKEDAARMLIDKFMVMKTSGDFIVNLLMIAILPAIGEELIFRGCLQRIFTRILGNYHVAIWLTAIIFSAIHLQFFGFLPRLLLGALFGYLLVWSNSLWIPILGHFINNSVVVVVTYIYQKKGLSISQADQFTTTTSPIIYLLSFAGVIILLYIFYKQAMRYRKLI